MNQEDDMDPPALPGWPLDREQTFAAFALMGLTSRLQPLQVNSADAQSIVTELAKKLGQDMARKFQK